MVLFKLHFHNFPSFFSPREYGSIDDVDVDLKINANFLDVSWFTSIYKWINFYLLFTNLSK